MSNMNQPSRLLDAVGYAPQPAQPQPQQSYMRPADAPPQQWAPPIDERHAPPPVQPAVAAPQPPAPQAPPPAAAASKEAAEVVLSKAYMAHGEPVTRFTLRKPLTREIRQCGNPLRPILNDDGTIRDVDVKWDVVAQYVPLLSNPPLPPPTVDQFEFWDLDACARALAPFFIRLAD